MDELPLYGDPEHADFWAAARDHVLVVQRCRCGAAQLPARPFCLRCGGRDLSFVAASGRGAVYSVTTVHVRAHTTLPPPYDVALVDLDEGPRLMATLEAPPGSVPIGARVELAWLEREPLPPLPVFRPGAQ